MNNYTFDTLVVIGWDPNVSIMPPIKNSKWKRTVLVGSLYSQISPEFVGDNILLVPSSAGRVFKHRRLLDVSNELPYQVKQSPEEQSVAFLRNSESSVAYACFDKKLARNIFELAALVKCETFANRYWYVGESSEEPVFEVIPDLFYGEKNRDVFNKMYNDLTIESRLAFDKFIELGINHLRFFIHAGYLQRKSLMPVDGWVLNIGGSWLSLVISMYGIRPTFVDSTIGRELYDNSRVRFAVAESTLIILSNYFTCVYYNGKVPYTFEFEDAKDRWSDIRLWDFIYSQYTTQIS